MKVKELMKVNFIRFSLLLGLSYVLLGEYGVVGFGYAWMLSYMVLTLVMLRISWREGWICIGKNK
jgi:O-antigen/teichoic acid export membrane protein